MWKVTKPEIKNDFKFYGFIQDFCQRLNDENPLVPTSAAFDNFEAIIDGQQRLTSLYLGLCSTYAYKLPRVNWPAVRDNIRMPPRKLYLDLSAALDPEEDESLLKYNFKFLTDAQYSQSLEQKTHHWYCLHEILRADKVEGASKVWSQIVKPYLEKHKLTDNDFAQETLSRLYEVIRNEKIIHYYKEDSQEIDHVLDVFIRTNNGGTKLEYSDLLMSVAVTNWNGNFKKEIEDLINQILRSPDMGFYFERDWILKTCLMLIGADVRFKVKNFRQEQVEDIQRNWDNIKNCIIETSKLIRKFGINPESLTSKNSVIPIAYYLFKQTFDNQLLFNSINTLAKHSEERARISRWFYMALLKGVFGGQADTILSSMKSVIDENLNKKMFPLEQIVDRYKSNANKNLKFDDDYIESLLDIEYGEGRCRALLHLLFPQMDPTVTYHLDHLHPQKAFARERLNKLGFLAEDNELMAFYTNKKHWNSIANLHLLDSSQNGSKLDSALKEWLERPGSLCSALLVDKELTSFERFSDFFKARREKLKELLKSNVYMNESETEVMIVDESDEQLMDDIVE